MSTSRSQKQPGRPYRMRRRAEHVDATHRRIVEAAVELHGSVGPAATTVAGIAELAGVTRATVYRHFPDDEALFAACTAHWIAGQHPPNPAAWSAVPDPQARLRHGLGELYRFYREGESMLRRVYRDVDELPASRHRELRARDRALHAQLVEPYDVPSRRKPTLAAAVRHVTSFWTWRSLCIDGGLSNDQAIELLVVLVDAATHD